MKLCIAMPSSICKPAVMHSKNSILQDLFKGFTAPFRVFIYHHNNHDNNHHYNETIWTAATIMKVIWSITIPAVSRLHFWHIINIFYKLISQICDDDNILFSSRFVIRLFREEGGGTKSLPIISKDLNEIFWGEWHK